MYLRAFPTLSSRHLSVIAAPLKPTKNNYRSYFPTSATNSNKFNQWYQQVTSFPKNLSTLYKQIIIYNNTTSAINSSQTNVRAPNAWTNKGIPRRIVEFRRQLKHDLSIVIPVAVGYVVVPVLGNIFVVLAFLSPRASLSRQFLTWEQIRQFAALDDSYRQRYYYRDIFKIFERKKGDNEHNCDLEEFCKQKLQDSGSTSSILKLDELPRENLITLALSQGTPFTNLHPSVAIPFYTYCIPTLYIRSKIQSIRDDIFVDDILLIRDKESDKLALSQLTDEDVLEACVLRGLPCSRRTSITEMRIALRYHLNLVSRLLSFNNEHLKIGHYASVLEGSNSVLKDIILYLPSIRHHFSSNFEKVTKTKL